jgi:hypothetical protein
VTSADRERLRAQVDQAKRLQIAKAHGLEQPWTDDPGYIGDLTTNQLKQARKRARNHARAST